MSTTGRGRREKIDSHEYDDDENVSNAHCTRHLLLRIARLTWLDPRWNLENQSYPLWRPPVSQEREERREERKMIQWMWQRTVQLEYLFSCRGTRVWIHPMQVRQIIDESIFYLLDHWFSHFFWFAFEYRLDEHRSHRKAHDTVCIWHTISPRCLKAIRADQSLLENFVCISKWLGHGTGESVSWRPHHEIGQGSVDREEREREREEEEKSAITWNQVKLLC